MFYDKNIHLPPHIQAELISKYQKKHHRLICECVWSDEATRINPPLADTGYWDESDIIYNHGGWTFLRVREDKHMANDEKTVNRVMQSFHENITQEELVEFLKTAKN